MLRRVGGVGGGGEGVRTGVRMWGREGEGGDEFPRMFTPVSFCKDTPLFTSFSIFVRR